MKLSVAALQGATRELQQKVSAPTLATCLGGVKVEFIMGFIGVKFTPKMGWFEFHDVGVCILYVCILCICMYICI